MYFGNTYVIDLPPGWSLVPPQTNDANTDQFKGPGLASLGIVVSHADSGETLAKLAASVIASIKAKSGATPQHQETIKIDGVTADLLTYHFTLQGIDVYELDAFCLRGGIVWEFSFGDRAGSEATDRAMYLTAIATVKLMA